MPRPFCFRAPTVCVCLVATLATLVGWACKATGPPLVKVVRPRPGRVVPVIPPVVVPAEHRTDDPPAEPTDLARILLKLHNERRDQAGLKPLELDQALTKAAEAHALDMAEREEMSHTGGDGSSPFQRIERAGFKFQRAAENVAAGQRTATEVMKDWMNSPGHRANILGDYRQLGVGRSKGANGASYWATTFGTTWPQLDAEAEALGVVDRLNDARKAERLDPLAVDPVLAKAAAGHSRAMAKAGKFLDRDDQGRNPFDVVRASGAKFQRLTLHLAYGPADAEAQARQLLDDADRRKEVLGDFDRVGVGVGQPEGAAPYWTFMLGKSAD